MDDFGRRMIGPLSFKKGSGCFVDPRAYGDLGIQATIQSAITDIGASERTLYIPVGTWSITSDLTIPSNIMLRVEQGAILNVATAKTLTINGGLDAGLYQIFDCVGTGEVVFAINSLREGFPQWWGGHSSVQTIVAQEVPTVPECPDVDLGAVAIIDWHKGAYARITLDYTLTTLHFINGYDGQKLILEVTQDNIGERELDFGTEVVGGTDMVLPLLLTETANKTDFLGFIYNSTKTKYYFVAASMGY
jgi:hypothetical protein